MGNEQTLIYLTGSNDEDIKEQYEQCMGLIENRRDEYVEEAVKMRHLQKLKLQSAVWATVENELELCIVADRPDIDRDGAGAGKVVSNIFDKRVDEMIVGDAKPNIIQAAHISEYLRKVDKITIANKRITFERGASPEHIHRILAMIKERRVTQDGDEILKSEWSGGRPPIGTEVVDGQLIKGEDFLDVRKILQKVVFQNLSKSEASRQIGCTRKTVGNTINKRHELFDIPQQ